MGREIYINVDLMETRVAVLVDRHLEEFYIERHDAKRLVGSLYKGRVESVLPGMGAAFVELGLEKNGFLYVSDIVKSASVLEGDMEPAEEDLPARRAKEKNLPSINEVAKKGDDFLVQIVKEPIGTKGCRLTTHISLPGHFLVLMPFSSNIGISKRIEDPKERDRIRKVLEGVNIPKDIGIVVRTASQGVDKRDIIREAKYLLRLWHNIRERAKRAKAPSVVYEEYELVLRVARDIMTNDVTHLEIDSNPEYRKLLRFVNAFSTGLRSKVRLHQGAAPLFDKHGIETQIDKLYSRVVVLKSGGYLVIEQTESLVAIDVNSGRFVGRKDLEDTAFRTNMEAANEVARQLRLRDLGGIIIIDFIDMEVPSHRQKVFRALEAALERDKAKTKILNISSIGLVEMTRQRMRKSIESATYDKCPYCNGRGTIKSATTVSVETTRKLEGFLAQHKYREVLVSLHPDAASHLLDPKRRVIPSMEKRFRTRIRVVEEKGLHLEDVKIEGVKTAR
jgi:ribonuclease G